MQQSSQWIVNSGVAHHYASDDHSFNNVADNNGPEEISMKMLTSYQFLTVVTLIQIESNSRFQLSNILCYNSISSNFILVSQYCRDNNTYIEFFTFSYLVNDLSRRAR